LDFSKNLIKLFLGANLKQGRQSASVWI